jgi:hypothetical protein
MSYADGKASLNNTKIYHTFLNVRASTSGILQCTEQVLLLIKTIFFCSLSWSCVLSAYMLAYGHVYISVINKLNNFVLKTKKTWVHTLAWMMLMV